MSDHAASSSSAPLLPQANPSALPSQRHVFRMPRPDNTDIALTRTASESGPRLKIDLPFKWQLTGSSGGRFQMAAMFIGVGYLIPRLIFNPAVTPAEAVVPFFMGGLFMAVGFGMWGSVVYELLEETGTEVEVAGKSVLCRVKRSLKEDSVLGGDLDEQVTVSVRVEPPSMTVTVNGEDRSEPEVFAEMVVGGRKQVFGRRRSLAELEWVCSEVHCFLEEVRSS